MAYSLHPTLVILLLAAVTAASNSTLPITPSMEHPVDPKAVFQTVDLRNFTATRLPGNFLKLLHKPDTRDIDNSMLKLNLGDKFDPEFMSIERPNDSERHNANATKTLEESADRIVTMLLSEATRQVRRKGRRQKQRESLKTAFMEAARVWTRYETDRWTQFRWVDLTKRFWPRWIKTASCSQSCTSRGNSCHKFEGEKEILRWQCLRIPKLDPQCFWIRTTVKLVTGCSSC
jgi:hypothetical protein